MREVQDFVEPKTPPAAGSLLMEPLLPAVAAQAGLCLGVVNMRRRFPSGPRVGGVDSRPVLPPLGPL